MLHERLFTRPLYVQVRDAIANRIAAGEWKPGAVMPNEGDLAGPSVPCPHVPRVQKRSNTGC